MLKGFSAVAGTWRFLTSMSLGLVLLTILIAFSILGAFNPDIFVSLWFLTLSGFLTVNILGCTVRRMQALLKQKNQVPVLLSQKGHHKLINLENFSIEKVTDEAQKELQQLGFRVQYLEKPQGRLITGKKHPWAHWGSPLLHLAIILVIIGSAVGGIWGQEKYVQVEVPGEVKLSQEGFPFDFRVKKFHMETYQDGTPKQYNSLLEVISANESKLEKAVSVNHPLNYQGVKIYQTSYGYNLHGAVREEKRSFDFKLQEGERIYLGGPGQFELEVQWPRYFVYSKGVPFTMGMAEIGEPIKLLNIEVVITDRIPYTGLQVKKDPGLPLIWLGFGLFLLALPLRFYIKSNQIWLLLSQTHTGVEVRLAAQHRVRGKGQEERLIEKLTGLNQKECSFTTC